MAAAQSLMSYSDFKRACISAITTVGASLVPQHRMRFDDHVIRKFRNMLVTAGTREALTEALIAMVGDIAARTSTYRIRYTDMEQVLAGDDDEETEWVIEGVTATRARRVDTSGVPAGTWQVRRILARVPNTGGRIYVVDWAPTEEPLKNLPEGMVAVFELQQCLLVRRTFFDDEAREA